MKVIFVLFIFLSPRGLLAFSQVDTINGTAYRNVVDYKNDKPLFKSVCIFKMYKESFSGLYKLKIKDKKYKRIRKMNIWIITDDDYIYFNAHRHAFDAGFLKLKKNGNYYYFKAHPSLSVYERKKIANSQVLYGFAGSSYVYNSIQYNNEGLEHNVLDLNK